MASIKVGRIDLSLTSMPFFIMEGHYIPLKHFASRFVMNSINFSAQKCL